MNLQSLCKPCCRRNKESLASKFCIGCKSALCTECVDSHATFKAFDSHQIVDLNVGSDQSTIFKEFCSKHQKMILELFCTDHDTLCCRSCLADDHGTCRKLVPLDVAAKGASISAMFADVLKDVKNLNNTAHELENEMGKAKYNLVESKGVARQKVKDFADSIIRRVNEIESKALSEIDSVFSKLSSQVDKDQINISKIVQEVRDITNQLDFIVRHGSDSQIFLLLNSLKPNGFLISKEIEKLIRAIKMPDIAYNESDVLSTLNTFGSVVINERPSDITYQSPTYKQVQILQQTSQIITKFNLLKKNDFSCCGSTRITGIAVTRDNRLIMCNESGKNLDVLTDEGQHIQKVALPWKPWGIVYANDIDEAWVSLQEIKLVAVVNTETYSLVRQVDVAGICFGIAFIGSNVALGSSGKVLVINKQGVLQRQISIDTGYVYSLRAKSSEVLYCCASENEKFLCLNLNGRKFL